jgi:uncharacterized protein (DUF3820 family)
MTSIIQENNTSIRDTNDFIVPFGRYKGQSITELVKDEHYFNWCMQQPPLKEKIKNLIPYVNQENKLYIHDINENISNNNNFIVPFGKYRGKFITELVKDEHYFNWCLQQPHINKIIINMYNNAINKTSSLEL